MLTKKFDSKSISMMSHTKNNIYKIYTKIINDTLIFYLICTIF